MKMNNLNKILGFSGLLIMLLFSSCKQKSKGEEVIGNYATGEVSRRHTLVDGKKEGKMVDYYLDGKLKSERFFKNDIQVDKSTFYYPSGKVQEVQYYDQGQKHGGDTIFYESGAPQMVVTFNHGQKDGYLRKWGEDGALIYEAKYAMEKLVEVNGESLGRDSIR
jgi:antitoxin component YwqK of YwqJK toxin-antitoxin module